MLLLQFNAAMKNLTSSAAILSPHRLISNLSKHGALWDIIVNGIKRNPELSSYHTLFTNSVRRRVRDYVHREVRQ